MKKNTRFIAETGIFIALTLVMQVITKSFGQLVTGSIVNLILCLVTMLSGMLSGVIVGVISPFTAFIFSIGTPFIILVPFISLGNFVYVFTIGKLKDKNGLLSIILASILKFLALYLIITKVVLKYMDLPIEKLKILSVTFSYPQLITALVGGLVSLLVIKSIKKGLKWEK